MDLSVSTRPLLVVEAVGSRVTQLYSFARNRGTSDEDASDLTQAFFVHLIEKHALRGVAPANGRFRAFLLASFKNFHSEHRRRAHALKRGGDWIQIPWILTFWK